jgi:hypothetical protein
MRRSKTVVWLAYRMWVSLPMEGENGEEHVLQFDTVPGLMGVMPVYATKADAIAAHGKGVKLVAVDVDPRGGDQTV